MIVRKQFQLLSMILIFACLTILRLIGSDAAQAAPPPQELNGDKVSIGDVVASGMSRGRNVCEFGKVTLRLTAPRNGKTNGWELDSIRNAKQSLMQNGKAIWRKGQRIWSMDSKVL